jgi:5-methylcytosine-specific restriction endonuclease McrA
MTNHDYFFDATLLQEQIKKLHMERKKSKIPSKRVGRLTKNERLLILAKTDNKCHICGQEISVNEFQADHVVSHIHGGVHKVDNYLPACFICNNYRWHYLPEELQLILKIGVWAKTEIERKSVVGNSMALKFVAKENRRINTKPRA